MKVCPVCGSRCFDDMEVCYGCLHDFTREDTTPAGQTVASSCEAEVEEAVLPASPASGFAAGAAPAGFVAGRGAEAAPSMPSQVPLIAEQPTTRIPCKTFSGGSVARVAQGHGARPQTHIVVPIDGCGGSPALAQGFRLVISVEPSI